jgi:putative nucleotidyltransferase with HDIG domain
MAAARARLESVDWPPALGRVLARLRAGGHLALMVGGTVRDVLLGRAGSAAFDVATDRPPDEVLAMFDRVEPIGLAHGTVLVLEDDVEIECTTLRTEGLYADARRPSSVAFTRDPLSDLARRDLTVNAMAWDPEARRLLDPFGGLADLEAGVLRAVGDPRERFTEDALRPLRVARFAATLEMTPEPGTRAALGIGPERAAGVAAERVRDELERMLSARRPSRGLELMRESGWLARVLPELDACVGVEQNRYHAFDVYRHSLAVCDAAPADWPEVRWAALLHDIGKPPTRAEKDGEGTFHKHAEAGARLADARLEALRFTAARRACIVHLIREHMFDYRPDWSDAAVRRWLRRVGVDHLEALFALREADVAGTGVPSQALPVSELRERIDRVLAASRVLSVRDLPVDGMDVMRVAGIGPGPEVGRLLRELLERVIEDPRESSREALLERLKAMCTHAKQTRCGP